MKPLGLHDYGQNGDYFDQNLDHDYFSDKTLKCKFFTSMYVEFHSSPQTTQQLRDSFSPQCFEYSAGNATRENLL